MGHSHAAHQKIENPGSLKASSALTGLFTVMVLIGLVGFFYAFSHDQLKAWTSFLRGHFYFMQISIAALFFCVICWVTSSMWSAPVRRVAEGITAYLPFALVSTILLFFGMKTLFIWTNHEVVANDPIISGKEGYLNPTFFIIRTLVAVIGWNLFQKKIVGSSLATDHGGDYKSVYMSNRKWGVAFLAFFAITFSMSAFDQLMSLDPHFFSTMFGVYTFAGSYQTFFATLAIITILLKRKGYLAKVVNENHIHDIAKLMFAFTVFWAYTGFSQYMLIWYANLPEETGYFLARFNPGWEPWSIGLFIGKFIVPFLLLLPRTFKRSESAVLIASIWILGTQYFDLNWMIQPQVYAYGPHLNLIDLSVWIGFFGVFGLFVTRFYKKNIVLSVNDPYLPESVYHHHI
jgi:hypothetical protein